MTQSDRNRLLWSVLKSSGWKTPALSFLIFAFIMGMVIILDESTSWGFMVLFVLVFGIAACLSWFEIERCWIGYREAINRYHTPLPISRTEEHTNFADFPQNGDVNVAYVTKSDSRVFRWLDFGYFLDRRSRT